MLDEIICEIMNKKFIRHSKEKILKESALKPKINDKIIFVSSITNKCKEKNMDDIEQFFTYGVVKEVLDDSVHIEYEEPEFGIKTSGNLNFGEFFQKENN